MGALSFCTRGRTLKVPQNKTMLNLLSKNTVLIVVGCAFNSVKVFGFSVCVCVLLLDVLIGNYKTEPGYTDLLSKQRRSILY